MFALFKQKITAVCLISLDECKHYFLYTHMYMYAICTYKKQWIQGWQTVHRKWCIKTCTCNLPQKLSCSKGDACNYYSSMCMPSSLFILKQKQNKPLCDSAATVSIQEMLTPQFISLAEPSLSWLWSSILVSFILATLPLWLPLLLNLLRLRSLYTHKTQQPF